MQNPVAVTAGFLPTPPSKLTLQRNVRLIAQVIRACGADDVAAAAGKLSFQMIDRVHTRRLPSRRLAG